MISIILTGRNDDYFGDFKSRLKYSLRTNMANLGKRNIPYEILFIEWNPTEGREYLSDELLREFPSIKYVVVDPLIHRHLCENKYIVFYEFFAKNIGASRASGDFVLFTNAEIIFGSDILDYISRNALDMGCFYRTNRVDVFESVREALKGTPDDLAIVGHEQYCKTRHYLGVPPYTNASGDFTLCSREAVAIAGGYDEAIKFSTSRQDSRFVCKLNNRLQAVVIGTVYHIDHIRHPNDIKFTDKSPLGPNYNPFANINSISGTEYGFRDITEDTKRDGKIFVSLKGHLRKAAADKILPEPILPEAYRIICQ